MTFEEMKSLPEDKQREIFDRIHSVRKQYKVVNYCLPLTTEVLTFSGWKKFDEISVGEPLPTYNLEKGICEPDNVLWTHFYKDSKTITYGNSRTRFTCTPNHRWVTRHARSGKVSIKGVDEFNTETCIILQAPYKSDHIGSVSPLEATFMGFLLSDGYYKWSERLGGTSNSFGSKRGLVISIAQAKDKYWRDIETCLESLGVKYAKDLSPRDNGNEVYIYRIPAEFGREILRKVMKAEVDKKDYNWTKWIMNLSDESMKAFYEAFYKGDGLCKHKDGYDRVCLSQNEGSLCDALIAVSQLVSGGRITVVGDKCKDILTHQKSHMTCQKTGVLSSQTEDTFCLTTKNGTFIIRQGGFVGITGNSAVYGLGPPRLARELKVKRDRAKNLLEAYWKKNDGVRKFSSDAEVKVVGGKMWVKNPVSGFWYSLRYEKDIFSTLNQSTGVFCFDTWVAYSRRSGVKITAQFHDEIVVFGRDAVVTPILLKAIEQTNEKLRLNVKLAIDAKHGSCYSSVH